MRKMEKGTYNLAAPLRVGSREIPALRVEEYGNGHIAIEAYHTVTEEDDAEGCDLLPYGRLSVNLPADAFLLGDDEFFATAYSALRPLYDAAIEQGIIEVVRENAGHAGMHGSVPICRFTDTALASLTVRPPYATV